MKNANQQNSHKEIILAITLTTLVCALSISIPVLGFFFFLILPLPAIYYRIRLGRKPAAIVMLLSFTLLMAIAGALTADIFFLSGMIILGFFMGEFIEKGLPVEKTIGYACAIVVFAGTFGLILYGNMSNPGLSSVVSDYIGKNLELTLMLYKKMEVPEENIRLLSNAMDQIRYVLVRIIPSLLAAGLLFAAWLNLLLTRMAFKSQKTNYAALCPLNIWKSPDFLVWGVIGFSLMLLLPNAFVKMLGLNGMILFVVIYFFQGMAIISFYFDKKKIPIVLRALLYGIIFIQQIFVFAIAGLGFFDVWLNFRKIGINNNNKQIPLSS
ncbi:MAG: YybS family protein [Dissulfuribacterales bacterium]